VSRCRSAKYVDDHQMLGDFFSHRDARRLTRSCRIGVGERPAVSGPDLGHVQSPPCLNVTVRCKFAFVVHCDDMLLMFSTPLTLPARSGRRRCGHDLGALAPDSRRDLEPSARMSGYWRHGRAETG